ncbi:uncharacterized protein A1O9_02086 [Exophiala aquamarina CBS 119918]|uniref:CCHC-type domain-containing protein n=1 Tax=Exophiala aquamarina CBS 119918 TaxID=1182545 RepID=A0A072PY33_9EURO|nr:uncharacterized protein A1O9_02086 [Exophiala aquamarina CBS 119918]KEF60525.1 hypothetical protein A1O9_02086 [Exophiala aquamarina CBS 119918]
MLIYDREIKQLPPGPHIFCPKKGDDDLDRYEGQHDPRSNHDTATNPDRLARIDEAARRKKKFISSLQLLAYDGHESEEYQRYIWDTIDEALGKCDICIREYYVEKLDFVAALRQDYEEEDIKTFFDIINRRDISRIIEGLTNAEKTLRSVPENKRGFQLLQQKDIHALFEALACESFLQDEDKVQTYFDEPFKMIQTRKPLKMREILPGTVRFLFDSKPARLSWATAVVWARFARSPTELEWDWAMKDCLQTKLQQASEPADIARLWSGLKLIVSKLDENMITHKLFDLQPSVATTGMNHLTKKIQAIPFIVQTWKIILDKAPDAFWQGMQSIPSQTIIEQVFASPQFNRCLRESVNEPELPDLDVLSWIPSFLKSHKPANRPAATQTLVYQLFERVNNTDLSLPARKACFEMAVKVLLQTLVIFSDNEKTRQSVERLVLSDILNLIGHRLDEILRPKDSALASSVSPASRENILSIVKNAVALECQNLKSDFETLSQRQTLPHGSSSYTPEIWMSVISNLQDDNTDLSSAALLGTMSLPGLEQFRMKNAEPFAKEKTTYNLIFEKLTGEVAKMLERITEFNPTHLDNLFRSQNTSMALIAALFSPDENTYQAAIDLVKNISGESGRKEALAHLVDAFLGTTIYALCWTYRRIANYKTFSSVPRMLKNGMEILDVLCNPADGQLRRSNISGRDVSAVQSYWSYQWIALRVIFSQAERWSLELHSKDAMMEVCRDAMQYARQLFDQYAVFSSVLVAAKPEKEMDIPMQLLDSSESQLGSPLNALDAMSKWLRLRDEYLADTLVSLIERMLEQLKRHQAVAADNNGLAYVQEVATKQSIKTIISPSQKARLVRALEQYYGKQIEKPAIKKQATLNLKNWTDSAAASRSEVSTPASKDDSADEFGDDDIPDNELVEVASRVLDTQKLPTATKGMKISRPLLTQPKPVKPKTSSVSAAQMAAKKAQDAKAFIENRKREEAARKLRDKEAALRLRGQTGVGQQTRGQGSGMAGLGIQGKDHSLGKSDLMVSDASASESESEDDLFTSRPRGPTVRTQTGQRGIVSQGPVRVKRGVQTQRDMRSRLAPDLSDLHKTMLNWEFFAETDLPPNSTRDDYTLVTSTFRSVEDYQRTFEPLLMLEGWQGLRSAREDGSFKPFEVKIANSLIVDSFLEINSQMPFAEGKDLPVSASDIVLLSKSKTPERDPSEPHCLARVKEITRKKGEIQVVYKVCASNNSLRPFLNNNSTIYGISVQSLTTLEREYGALKALPYYYLRDYIVKAEPSGMLEYPEKELLPLTSTYNVNLAQAKAIKSALDNDAFSLIQGPPGSGKTKTICALVGAMLTAPLKRPASYVSRFSNSGGASDSAPQKILVCAPSNAAVDELVIRFKDGVTLMDGSQESLSVVRLGRSDAINSKVKDVTLEELVNTKLSLAAPKDPREDIHSLMKEHKSASEDLNALRGKLNEQRGKGETILTSDERLMDGLRRKKNALGTQIDKMRERQNTASRDMELSRRRAQQEVLNNAKVLCATLSGSGHELFQGLSIDFDTVIIDEAAQSIELSALIPLKYNCAKCILVGDPKQLPPTVLSREAARFQYEQSLFARMENNHKKDVHLLDTQYRMHPEISLFPSKTFYDSRLRDGNNMAQLRRRPWHHSEVFAPYRFFDVQGMSQSAAKGHSLINLAELNVAMQLYDRLTTDVRRYDFSGKIGIITPYKGQLNELKKRFQQQYGESILSKIDFNTTDAFQGRESEIIIFSCVRASTQGIGFLRDIRRMNVGLTRAKSSLWILGNSEALIQGEFWRALVNDAKSRKLYTEGDILGLLRRPLLTEDMMKDDIEMMDVDQSISKPTNAQVGQYSLNQAVVKEFPAAASKTIRDEPRSGATSQRNTPVPSRPSSNLSRTSSTSSSTKAEHQSSNQSDTGRDKPRNESLHQEPLSAHQPQTSHQAAPRPDFNSGTYGPSGGANGLNAQAVCVICGSFAHFSFNCDNGEALAAAIGKCSRCHLSGHTASSCLAPRCKSCGEVGHLTKECTAAEKYRLKPDQQEKVKREEIRWNHLRDRNRTKRAEKQLGEHGAKIPNVKSSVPPDSAAVAKRKREDGALTMRDASDWSKVPRLDTSTSIEHNRDPRRPKAPQPGPAAQPRGAVNSPSSQRPPAGAGAGLPARSPAGPGGRPGIMPGQSMVRRKKSNADAMFVKKK